jgi:hypothetical protein
MILSIKQWTESSCLTGEGKITENGGMRAYMVAWKSDTITWGESDVSVEGG